MPRDASLAMFFFQSCLNGPTKEKNKEKKWKKIYIQREKMEKKIAYKEKKNSET